ncbi:MAG TPA: hypothetical protein ENL16_02400 [Candidatus Woesearchaeota archaeon]|nr:hypothetical protein [Candidatus Woesearchaeota archaeon]
MMFSNPAKDFLLRAARHAKEIRMKELNYLEAELIVAEEDLDRLKKKGISPHHLNIIENRIDDLKRIIKNKKQAL